MTRHVSDMSESKLDTRGVSDATTASQNGGLAAVIVLAGAVRPTPFMHALRRSVLDLPIDQHRSIWQHWQDHLQTLSAYLNCVRLPVRLVINRKAFHPATPSKTGRLAVSVERDQSEYRGTAGLLRDISDAYDDAEYLLVVNGMQVWRGELGAWVVAGGGRGADLCLLSHRDGTPGGLMLVRCGVLKSIPRVGYIDMKEQALPRIARDHQVEVMTTERSTGMPVRTRGQYIRALRWYHEYHESSEANPADHPYREQWQKRFGIVEDGAEVGPDVCVHDSVVLRGARVEGKTVLVRSVVCSDTQARADAPMIDRVIGNGRSYSGD